MADALLDKLKRFLSSFEESVKLVREMRDRLFGASVLINCVTLVTHDVKLYEAAKKRIDVVKSSDV